MKLEKFKYFKVSIVAICHAHYEFVLETLESIKAQTYSNVEIVVINNLNDECKPIIEDWIKKNPKLKTKFIENKEPLSVTQNANLALANITGEYFQLISCDDVLLPHKIESQVKILDKHPEVSCVFSNITKIDSKSNFIKNIEPYEHLSEGVVSNEKMVKGLAKNSFVKAPSVLIKTSAIINIGGYDESLRVEDAPTWIKLAYHNFKFYYQNQTTVQYRILENSLYHSRKKTFPKNPLAFRLYYYKFLRYDSEHQEIFFKICYRLIRSGYSLNMKEINQIRRKIKPKSFFYLRILGELLYLKIRKINKVAKIDR